MFLFDTKEFEGLMRMRSNQSDINLEEDTDISTKVQVNSFGATFTSCSVTCLLIYIFMNTTSIKKKILDQLSEIK